MNETPLQPFDITWNIKDLFELIKFNGEEAAIERMSDTFNKKYLKEIIEEIKNTTPYS